MFKCILFLCICTAAADDDYFDFPHLHDYINDSPEPEEGNTAYIFRIVVVVAPIFVILVVLVLCYQCCHTAHISNQSHETLQQRGRMHATPVPTVTTNVSQLLRQRSRTSAARVNHPDCDDLIARATRLAPSAPREELILPVSPSVRASNNVSDDLPPSYDEVMAGEQRAGLV